MHCVITPNWKHKKVWQSAQIYVEFTLRGFTPFCLSTNHSWNNPKWSKPSSSPYHSKWRRKSSMNYNGAFSFYVLQWYEGEERRANTVSSLQDVIIIKQNEDSFYGQGGFVCFVLWKEGGTRGARLGLIPVRARGLSTSCVQTTHTLCLCLGALTGAGGGDGGRGSRLWVSWGCTKCSFSLRLHATVTSASDMWRLWAHPSSPLTAKLLLQADEGGQIWCTVDLLL